MKYKCDKFCGNGARWTDKVDRLFGKLCRSVRMPASLELGPVLRLRQMPGGDCLLQQERCLCSAPPPESPATVSVNGGRTGVTLPQPPRKPKQLTSISVRLFRLTQLRFSDHIFFLFSKRPKTNVGVCRFALCFEFESRF